MAGDNTKGHAAGTKTGDVIHVFKGGSIQMLFIIGWNRSTDPKQRCRVIVASNPPDNARGFMGCEILGPLARHDTSASCEAG